MSVAGAKWLNQPFSKAPPPSLGSWGSWWGGFCSGSQGQHHVEIEEGSTTWLLPAHVRRLAAQDFIIRDGDTEMAAVTANPHAFKAGDCIQLIDADTEEEWLTLRWDDRVLRIRRKGQTVAHVCRDSSDATDAWHVFHGECRTRDFSRLIGSRDHLLSLLEPDGGDGSTHVYKGDRSDSELVAETFRLGSPNDFMEYEVSVNNGCDIALVLAALVAKDYDMDRRTTAEAYNDVTEVINSTMACECGTLLCPRGRNPSSRYLKDNPAVRRGSRRDSYGPPQDAGRFDDGDDNGEEDPAGTRDGSFQDGWASPSSASGRGGAQGSPQWQRRESDVGSVQDDRQQEVGTCPLGHHLKPFVTDIGGYQCSHCNRESMRGSTIYQCASCSYDMCESCYSSGVQQLSVKPKETNAVSCGDSELPVKELRTGVQHYFDRLYCLRGVPAALHGAQLVMTPWQAGGMDFRIMVGDSTVCVLLAHGAKNDYPSGVDELESQLKRLDFSKVVLPEMRTDSFPDSGVDLWRRAVDSRIVLSIGTRADIEFNICFIDSAMDQAMVQLRDTAAHYGDGKESPQFGNGSPGGQADEWSSHGHGGGRDDREKTAFAAGADAHRAVVPQLQSRRVDDDGSDDGSDDGFVHMSPREGWQDTPSRQTPPRAGPAHHAPPRPAPAPARQQHRGRGRGDDDGGSDSSRSRDSSPDLPGGRLLTPRPPDSICFNQDELNTFRESGRTVEH